MPVIGAAKAAVEKARIAAGLIDARRQHHHCALVEDDLPLETRCADAFEHRILVGLPGGDDPAADGQRGHAARLQRGHQFRRRFGRDQTFFLALGEVEQGAVLGDHEVEQVQPIVNAPQVWKLPTGYQKQLSSAFAQALESADRGGVDHAVMCERSVVIRGKGDQVHVDTVLVTR